MMDELSPGLPPGYYLVRDPDTLALHRSGGSPVAVFSARGVEPGEVRRAAETDGGPTGAGQGLRVRFLGGFELFCGDRRVGLGRNAKASAILKYLMAHRKTSVSRDYLMEWLWPESNAKRAKGSLNTAIYSVRAILDRCRRLPGSRGSRVLLEGGRYRLCPEIAVHTDVEDFEARCDRGRSLEREGQMEIAIAEYEGAVELYRGDYLSEDLYEEWTMIERQRLANSYLEVLDRLSRYYADTERYERCVRVCYKILEKEPYYENAHRLLMYSNARLGLRTRALQQYRLYARMLKTKFDAEPSAEIEALHLCILGGGQRAKMGSNRPNSS